MDFTLFPSHYEAGYRSVKGWASASHLPYDHTLNFTHLPEVLNVRIPPHFAELHQRNMAGAKRSGVRQQPAALQSPIVVGFMENGETEMATLGLIEYEQASPEVRAVYDDIMATRKTDRVNNFWKAIAHDLTTLRRTWQGVKEIMTPGALDALTKEMIYVAVSVTNQCNYCIASHSAVARKAGMTDSMFSELMAVVGMANETNRLASGYQVEIDDQFKPM